MDQFGCSLPCPISLCSPYHTPRVPLQSHLIFPHDSLDSCRSFNLPLHIPMPHHTAAQRFDLCRISASLHSCDVTGAYRGYSYFLSSLESAGQSQCRPHLPPTLV